MKLYSLAPHLIWNRAKVAYSYLTRSAHNKGRPIEVVIESTNACNLKCPMCPRFQDNTMSTRGIGLMDMAVFTKIVDQIKDFSETIDLHLAGEPLMHPKIIDMINYCGSYGLKTVIHTNASFLTEKKSRELVNSALTVLDISFDGNSKETYEQIRIGAKFEETTRNVERYLEIRKQNAGRGPYSSIHMTYMKKNQHEADSFLKKWKKAGMDAVRIKAFNETGLSGENRQMGVVKKIFSGKEKFKPCFMMWRFLTVHWDGTIVPCCLDYVGQEPLGNIMKEDLNVLWNGPKMKRMRTLHIEGKAGSIALCKDCSMPTISTPFLLASIFVHNDTIKKRLLPILERLWVLKKFNLFKYYSD